MHQDGMGIAITNQEPPRSPKPASPKLPTTPLMLAALFLFVGVTGFLIGKYFNTPIENSDIQSNPPQLALPTPSPSTVPFDPPTTDINDVDTSNWQAYRNEDYEYELLVPPTWEIFRQTGNDSVMSIRPKNTETIPITISVLENVNNLSLSDWLNTQFSDTVHRTEETINNNAWVVVYFDLSLPNQSYFASNGKFLYSLGVSTLDESYISTFDKILSTFRFLEERELQQLRRGYDNGLDIFANSYFSAWIANDVDFIVANTNGELESVMLNYPISHNITDYEIKDIILDSTSSASFTLVLYAENNERWLTNHYWDGIPTPITFRTVKVADKTWNMEVFYFPGTLQ